MNELAGLERARLTELEKIVERGLATFVDVGLALGEIRDSRLYRGTYGTFQDYLYERWSISRRHGYRLIDAARVAELVCPVGHIANERQARELVPLLDEPEALTEAWEEAVIESGGKPTAAVVAEKVKERRVTAEELVDQEVFRSGAHAMCPTCGGTGVVPVETIGGETK